MASIAGEGRSPTLTLSAAGIALVSARAASAAPRPRSSTGGWMPRARSRSSASVSLALRWAAPTRNRVRPPSGSRPRPAGGVVQALLDLAQGHGQRRQADLRPVVQVALDAAEPGGRLVHRAGPLLLQLAGALGRGRDAGLGIALGLQPRGAVLQRGVVGAAVAVGDGIAQHPGRQRRAAERDGRREHRVLRVRPCWPGSTGRWRRADSSRQITRPETDTRRDRCAARVYSSTAMARSATHGSSAGCAGARQAAGRRRSAPRRSPSPPRTPPRGIAAGVSP